MKSICLAAWLFVASLSAVNAQSCVGSEDVIGIDRQLFLNGMRAAGFDLKVASKCNDRGCQFEFDGGDGFLTVQRDCVTKAFATIKWPDQRKRASIFMIALATAIARREPSKQTSDLMMTAFVADEGQSISFGDPGKLAARYKIGPYIVDVSVESAEIMTAERKRREEERVERRKERARQAGVA